MTFRLSELDVTLPYEQNYILVDSKGEILFSGILTKEALDKLDEEEKTLDLLDRDVKSIRVKNDTLIVELFEEGEM